MGRITDRGVEGAAATDDQFMCVTNVIAAANGSRISFGFVGNEQYGD
ncbi:MAG: hypothetical protein ABW039_05895 [Sphingobium sp.]